MDPHPGLTHTLIRFVPDQTVDLLLLGKSLTGCPGHERIPARRIHEYIGGIEAGRSEAEEAGRKQHEETLAQLRITQRQVDASLENAYAAKAAAESVINAERAWVMGELGWDDNVKLRSKNGVP